MKKTKILILIAIAATVSACGDLEWFPPVADATPPTVSASISGISFSNKTTHVSSLPATVTFFSANEPATIYYTTNGTTPTTFSSSIIIPTTTAGVAGPSISVTDTILKFFGIDKLSNASTVQSGTVKSP